MQHEAVPLVSVVMPVRNEAPHIRECIEALQSQTYPRDRLEFVVADGSTDGTTDILARLSHDDPRLRVVPSRSGRTPVGLNLAIANARGTVIARMDAHAVPAIDYIERCCEVLLDSGAWAVGGRMVKTGLGPRGRSIAAASSSPFGVGDSAFHYATEPRSVESVYLGCWPREVLDRVGPFDEELTRNQDDELSYRIRAAGGSIWFDPRISVVYRPRETFRGLFDQHRQYGFWKISVFRKQPGAIRWRHLVPGILVVAMGSVPLGLIHRAAALPGLLGGGLYAVVASVAAASVARRVSGVHFHEVLSAFASMHVGYGIGLCEGLIVWALRNHEQR